MLNSGERKKYSNSRVVRKKNSERNKKTITPSPLPPFKLNGRSLIHVLPFILTIHNFPLSQFMLTWIRFKKRYTL